MNLSKATIRELRAIATEGGKDAVMANALLEAAGDNPLGNGGET